VADADAADVQQKRPAEEQPLPAIDIRDVQVIKEDRTFFLSDAFGDVPRGNRSALGLYHMDTRFLSRLELTINRLKPMLLHSSTERNYSQLVELVYPIVMVDPSGHERKENISLHRFRVLSGALFERLRVRNFGMKDRSVRVTMEFDADFRDIFEVRGMERGRRGQVQRPRVEHNQVVMGYLGLDGETRTTTIRFSPAPDEMDESRATFLLKVSPGQEIEIALEVIPEIGGSTVPRRAAHQVEDGLARDYTSWRKRCTRFRTGNIQMSNFLDRSILDLRMLLARDDRGTQYIDAGVPWFSALFGRDSLITAYQTLGVNPDMAWGVLRGLAEYQGQQEDDWREEEPGKIPHEARVGELARCEEIPHTPYYGSIDATPLWIVLYASAFRWTADYEAAQELWPNALAALRWIDEHGDRDGDGYLEYEKRSPQGLDNQGWKDSHDAVAFPDGELAKPPIALVEVQAYVFAAKSQLAQVALALGESDEAARLEQEASALKDRFNRDFWLEKEGYYALALDRDKRPVPTITSNPGHALWAGIVDPRFALKVAQRLVSPALLSGWGIRTLSNRHPVFDPIGYHTGTVWPHDNSLIAHGLKRYGFDRQALAVLDQLALAGAYFPYGRFPELFCGFSSERVPVPVQYPVACRPQAWASGTPLLMVRSYGGLVADAPNARLFINRPRLPRWVDRVEILGMRVGKAKLDLVFTQTDGVTATHVPRKEGDLEVLIRQ
jgi:glycogen debranching enzyme